MLLFVINMKRWTQSTSIHNVRHAGRSIVVARMGLVHMTGRLYGEYVKCENHGAQRNINVTQTLTET